MKGRVYMDIQKEQQKFDEGLRAFEEKMKKEFSSALERCSTAGEAQGVIDDYRTALNKILDAEVLQMSVSRPWKYDIIVRCDNIHWQIIQEGEKRRDELPDHAPMQTQGQQRQQGKECDI
jgi:hypothetical protein